MAKAVMKMIVHTAMVCYRALLVLTKEQPRVCRYALHSNMVSDLRKNICRCRCVCVKSKSES